jgi:hypothetical protein
MLTGLLLSFLAALPARAQAPTDTLPTQLRITDTLLLLPSDQPADMDSLDGVQTVRPDSLPAAESRPSRASGSHTPAWLPADSLAVYSYPPHRPWERRAHPLPGINEVRRYDPLDQPFGPEYARLHNLGTAGLVLGPRPVRPIGFEAGGLALRPYLLDTDSLRFLLSRTPYSDVYYSQGRTSEDGLFRGKLARRFGQGTDVYIEALRIYNDGEYARLANHHSSLRTGLRYQSPSGRYGLTLLHGNHILDQEESGGIRTDTLLGDLFYQTRVNVPVRLGQARFRYRETDYQIGQQLALAGSVDRDSLGRVLFRHRLRWQDRSFKFSDTNPGENAAFYGPFATDERGLRQFTSWTTLSNLATALLSWQSSQGQAISLEGGVEHRYHRWDNEGRSATLQNLLLTTQLDMRWRNLIDIRSRAQLDLGDQAGAWSLDGEAGLQAGRWGRLVAGLALNRRFVDLAEQEMVVSRRTVYQENWSTTQQQILHGRLELPGLALSLGVHFSLITNAIFFEAPGLPRQLSATVPQSQLWASHRLRLGAFHLDQRVIAQQSGDGRLPLPSWISRHDLYYEGLWFRKSLRTRIGAELRLISPWTPLGYMPVQQAFFLQEGPQKGWFPQLDLYVALERLGFRFFFEMENTGQMIFGWKGTARNGASIPRVFYQVADYPMPQNWLRFGLAFTFRG